MFDSLKYRARLYPLERNLLSQVIDCAPANYKESLRCQLESINKIQRHADFKEINMYRMKKGKPSFDSNIALPYSEQEHVICKISFTIKNSKTNFKIKAWLIEGFLFTITFNKSPKRFMKCDDIVIKKVSSSFSNLTAESANQVNSNEIGNSQKLEELLGEHNFERIFPPISVADQERFIDDIDSKLPDDYIQLISYVNGFVIDDWQVHGLDGIRQVVGKVTNHYVLAETFDGYLTVEEGSDKPIIFFNKHDQDAIEIGESFIQVLKTLLE